MQVDRLLLTCAVLFKAGLSNLHILQERNLALHSEGVKMVVDSEQPHFVGVDPDILSTGLVFYYFKVQLYVCSLTVYPFHHNKR